MKKWEKLSSWKGNWALQTERFPRGAQADPSLPLRMELELPSGYLTALHVLALNAGSSQAPVHWLLTKAAQHGVRFSPFPSRVRTIYETEERMDQDIFINKL